VQENVRKKTSKHAVGRTLKKNRARIVNRKKNWGKTGKTIHGGITNTAPSGKILTKKKKGGRRRFWAKVLKEKSSWAPWGGDRRGLCKGGKSDREGKSGRKGLDKTKSGTLENGDHSEMCNQQGLTKNHRHGGEKQI